MTGIEFDALVNLIFQARGLTVISEFFDSFVFMGWLCLLFIGLVVCVCGIAEVEGEVFLRYKGIFVSAVSLFLMMIIVGMCGRSYFSYKASLLPNMSDAKLIITYKVGEEVVESPEFKRFVEAATKKLEETGK